MIDSSKSAVITEDPAFPLPFTFTHPQHAVSGQRKLFIRELSLLINKHIVDELTASTSYETFKEIKLAIKGNLPIKDSAALLWKSFEYFLCVREVNVHVRYLLASTRVWNGTASLLDVWELAKKHDIDADVRNDVRNDAAKPPLSLDQRLDLLDHSIWTFMKKNYSLCLISACMVCVVYTLLWAK